MPDLIDDATTRILESALDGLSLRQQVIGNNIANAETPGYQAMAVSFEGQLEKAMKSSTATGIPQAVTHTGHLAAPAPQTDQARIVQRPGGSARLDGNNVDIDSEMSLLAETSIRYQSLTQLVGRKLALLKAIATGR